MGREMDDLHPDRIMAVGSGYWASKVLLSAVGLGLFTQLGEDAMTAPVLAERLGLRRISPAVRLQRLPVAT